jgi:hypothetical protein
MADPFRTHKMIFLLYWTDLMFEKIERNKPAISQQLKPFHSFQEQTLKDGFFN